MEWLMENCNFEARNPKFETNSNDRNTKFKMTSFWKFEFCYCFGFRYSDFIFAPAIQGREIR
jgi:hypothetical protein